MTRLAAAGVRHEPVVRTAWGQFAFCWDPEGNPLQLYESAYIRPDADPEALFAAANLEQDWQAEQWGWDWEAEQTRARKLAAFVAAARFASLARK